MSKQVLIYVNRATHITNRIWVYASPDQKISAVLYEAMKVVECSSVWGGADKRNVTETLLTTMTSIEVAPGLTSGIVQVLAAYLRKQLPQVAFSYFEGDAFRAESHELTSSVDLMKQITSSEELLQIIHAIEAQAHEEDAEFRTQLGGAQLDTDQDTENPCYRRN